MKQMATRLANSIKAEVALKRVKSPKISSCRGAALITVLLMLAVVTVLLVGFSMMASMDRSASASYSGGVRVEQLAMAGLENVVLDFRREIAAGSRDDETNRKAGYARYYEPYRDTNEVALSILPRRIGYPSSVKNAIRRSVGFKGESDYYTNFPKLSSTTNGYPYYVTNRDVHLPEPVLYTADTTATSLNHRSVSISRWNKPRLVNMNDTAERRGFTDNPPSWVYVSRGGTMKSITDTNSLKDRESDSYIIGRYAYVVYDVGGLVDITVAGHATNAVLNNSFTNATNDSNNISWAKKGLLQAADLSLLRIVDSSGSERPIDATSLNNLLIWRDTNVVASASNYAKYLFGATNYSATNTNFMAMDSNVYAKSGFTQVGGNNNTFISRQDLIAYCSTNSRLKDFLPMFTTFSREKNAPSWGPRTYNTSDTSRKYGYNSNSYTAYSDSGYQSSASTTFEGYPNLIVTNISGVRYPIKPTSFRTVTPEGCVLVYTNQNRSNNRVIYTNTEPPVKAGSPVMRKRFPLSRIAWLTLTNNGTDYGPRADLTNAIHQAFGLVWDRGDSAKGFQGNVTNADAYGMPHWVYTSAEGTSSAASRIKTLSDLTNKSIVQTPRDPDFFETLKASILDGSLGVVEAYSTSNTYCRITNYTPIQVDMYDMYKNPDIQLIRIGACIIDQADEDWFATAITFKNTINSSAETNETLYGVESLPYMSHLWGFNGGLNKGTLNPDHPADGLWASWITPGVWDPHQNASQPTNFSTDKNVNSSSAASIQSNYFKPNVPMYYRVWALGTTYTMVDWASYKEMETNTNPTSMYYTYTNGTNIIKATNVYHPIRTPNFNGSQGYRCMGTNSWTPSKDMIYFDRSPTNLFYILDQNNKYTNGRMNQYGAGQSDANGIDTNNRSSFDEPILLIRAYANSRSLLENGVTTNGTNANYYTNAKLYAVSYSYYNSMSVNGESYTYINGNYFWGTNGDGQMHGVDNLLTGTGSSASTVTKTNHTSWYVWDYRPAIIGFNTGIAKPPASRSASVSDNFGRHYVLDDSVVPTEVQSDTNTNYNKEAYKYRQITNYAMQASQPFPSDVRKYGGDPTDGKVLDVFGTTGGTNSDALASTSNRPVFVFQASTNPVTGPWRTYEVVKNVVGSWGGISNAGHQNQSYGEYYSGANYSKKSGSSVRLYEPPEDGMEPWANTGSMVLDPRTLRLGISHPYENTDPYGSTADNAVLCTIAPNCTNMNGYLGISKIPGWNHAGKYIVGKGFFSMDYSNVFTSYASWPTALTGAQTNTNFSTFFYMINTLDVTNSQMFRFNTKNHVDGSTTWSYGGTGFLGYADRDGVVRAGDAYLGVYSGSTNQILLNPMEVSDNYTGRTRQIQDRPVMLNRAFRSVGELGYVFRDMPWKTLDFFTTNSADAGLLDTFSSYDVTTDYTAGKVNLNTPYPSVLASLMSGVIQNEKSWEFIMQQGGGNKANGIGFIGSTRMKYTDGSKLATANYNNNKAYRTQYNSHPTNTLTNIVNKATNGLIMATNIVYNAGVTNTNTNVSTPFLNISQFVTRHVTNTNYPTPSSVVTNDSRTFNTNPYTPYEPDSIFFLPLQKTQREMYIRSLAECTQTRTWNFLIDIIAQTGHFIGGDNGNDSLNQFVVEGERRFWLHIAIDRYTGEVVDQRLEPVND